jgi:phage shock protein C
VKRLYKSRKNKVIDGVCGGLANYFNVDPVLVRIVFVLFFFLGGSGLIAYIIGMIIMPREPFEVEQEAEAEREPAGTSPKPLEEPAQQETGPASSPSAGSLIIGALLIIIGGFFLMRNFGFFSGFYWWFRSHFWEYLIPGAIIVTGIALIVKGTEK